MDFITDTIADTVDSVSAFLRAKRAATIAAYCATLEKGGETLGLTPIKSGVNGDTVVIGYKVGGQVYFLPDAKSRIVNMDALYSDPELIV